MEKHPEYLSSKLAAYKAINCDLAKRVTTLEKKLAKVHRKKIEDQRQVLNQGKRYRKLLRDIVTAGEGLPGFKSTMSSVFAKAGMSLDCFKELQRSHSDVDIKSKLEALMKTPTKLSAISVKKTLAFSTKVSLFPDEKSKQANRRHSHATSSSSGVNYSAQSSTLKRMSTQFETPARVSQRPLRTCRLSTTPSYRKHNLSKKLRG